MKVLWISNAPWAPSGYGSQTRQAGLRIARAGYEIEFVANDGSRGDREWEGLLVRGSSGADRYSRDSLREDLARSGADWVISLYDAWVYTDQMADPFEGVPHVAGWVPVDHFPTPRTLFGWLSNGHLPIAMSQYGRNCLTATSEFFAAEGAKPFPVRYVPHAIDDVFYPRDRSFRSEIGVPDSAFLVGIVAANNGTKIYDRKGFGDMAHALGVFMESHRDVYVYVHTILASQDGMDLNYLFGLKGLPPDRLRIADQYALKKQTISDDDMARIYSALDVFLLTSRGEGFGIPVVEAQACGVPVIASNWTAQAELVGNVWRQDQMGAQRHPSGWLVPVEPDYDPRHVADFGKPRLGAILGALSEAYERRGDATLRDAAIAKAEGYRADAVFDRYWRPILADMEAQLREPNRGERRAARQAAASANRRRRQLRAVG